MATRGAITFDFHDTLASCDRWFDLEVRSLPWEALDRVADFRDAGEGAVDPQRVTATYRELRGEIVGHGVEMDALAGVVETFRRLGIGVPPASLLSVIDDLMREALADAAPMPGAIETVRSLHEVGFRLGVISSAVYHPFLLWVLEKFGILPLFSSVVTSASSGFYKSRPEIYRRALADLNAEASSACHVGDSVRWDHGMAKSLGMRTILVTSKAVDVGGGQPAPDLRLTSLVGAAGAIHALAAAPGGHAAPR